MHINVAHFSRKPYDSSFISIERLFSDIRKAMPDEINSRLVEMPFYSKGFINRVFNIIFSSFHQSEVNHVVGDIHYVNLLMRKSKTILTIHDCAPIEQLNGIKKWILIKLWYTWPIKRSSIVTAISESTKKEILKYVNCPEDKIIIIRNCISNDFKHNQKPFNKEYPTFLHIGTSYNKNLLRHIEAIKEIKCKLVIIGKLKEQHILALKESSIDYDNFVGISDAEIIAQYENCDVVLFCSTYEGFGLPIIEANAIGRPVLTSNIYSMPEVASNAACIADPFDVNSIKNGIEKIIGDANYREQLIKNGLHNAEAYTQESVANEYAKIYKNIAIK